jgi:hypothetical protein
MKISANVFYMEFVHIRDVAKKLTRLVKIMCYNPRKWPDTDVFAKTHLRTLLARRPTPGGVRNLIMVGTWRRDRQSDEMHHFGFRLGK